ncbi:MAG: type II toxin-antitoxin system RelE/ParE family toxin [Cyanobacteria bacterium P01_C01_bin.38]
MDSLAINPRPDGVKKLKNRVSDYRILYDIFDDVLIISVVEVGHSSNIYKDKS